MSEEVKPTPEDLTRDAVADLAVCASARPTEDWAQDRGELHATAEGFVLYDDFDYCATVEDHLSFGCSAVAYARLFATAGVALPAWIRRAVHAEAQCATMRELLSAEPKVRKVTYTPEDGVECQIEHWAVRHLAVSALDSFEKSGGANFVTFTLHHPSRGPIEVTVRPCWGGKKTTAQVLDELRAEIECQREVILAVGRLLALPNWENRVGPWKDINEAVSGVREAFARAGGTKEGA